MEGDIFSHNDTTLSFLSLSFLFSTSSQSMLVQLKYVCLEQWFAFMRKVKAGLDGIDSHRAQEQEKLAKIRWHGFIDSLNMI